MAERARRDGEKGRRDEDEFAASNVDSGFLSAGNMQISGEVRDTGTPRQGDDRRMENEGRQAAAPAPEATTLTSSSATVAAAIAEEPMRVIDSGVVDVDLSEGLNQLTLKKQPGLGDSGDLARPEPTATLLLTPVKTEPRSCHRNHDLLPEQHRRDDAKSCAIMNENTWQLYYAQDDDGDT